ncbi:MAG: hypothetical protein H8E85_08040 [Candidatus Marinimicrobia bacterium]|nr:hypothetical protein [Candidatus Neomarinimicrobiota bacterium]
MNYKRYNKFLTYITILLMIGISFIYSQNCNEGYSYVAELPETATISSGDSCFYNVDINALNDLISANNLDYDIALEVGNQTWGDGRLTVLVGTFNPNGTSGINSQLQVIPESFGDLTGLALLYLEWHSLTSLPESFSQLTNLVSFTINNNWLTHLPSEIGNLSNLYSLDLGYNKIESIPDSICELENLVYLLLFNNELTTVPECICDLPVDWSGFDGWGIPFFGIGGNYLCNDIPDCIESSSNFELSLDQFYYLTPIEAPQDCCPNLGDLNGDGGYNVLDIVTLANCVLAGDCSDLENGCAGDLNGDGGYNVLDIVTLANCVLAGNCEGN